MLSKEELLKPRVIVENLYPECPFSAGQILYLDEKRVGGPMYVDEVESRDPDYILKREADNYPYLFRPLSWWEERDERDMPEYVKWVDPSDKSVQYFQVFQWFKSGNEGQSWLCDIKLAYLFIKDVEPATESEYTAYQLSQKVK